MLDPEANRKGCFKKEWPTVLNATKGISPISIGKWPVQFGAAL